MRESIKRGNTDFDYAAMPDADAEEARESLIEEKTALRLLIRLAAA